MVNNKANNKIINNIYSTIIYNKYIASLSYLYKIIR